MEAQQQSVQEQATNLGFKLIPPLPSQEDINNNPLILVRHGTSVFNMVSAGIKKEHEGGDHSEKHMEFMVKPEYIDNDLHEFGVMQAETAQEHVNKLNVKTVLVSPVQRAIQTAVHMFKNHPNKENITLVIAPIMREIMHTSNDIPADYDFVMERYGQGKPDAHGLKFDFSMFFLFGRPQLWTIYVLSTIAKQRQVLQELKETTPGKYNLQETLLKIMGDAIQQHGSFETEAEIFVRAQRCREFLKEYLRANPVNGDEKIAVVCHSKIIAGMTAKGVNSNGKLEGFFWPENCQQLPFSP